MKKFLYKYKDKLMTEIYVDYKKETVRIANHSEDVCHLAFGVKQNPSFKDFEELLEDRCFPKTRDNLKLHLKELGLDYYDPYLIVLKTKGRLEGDFESLELVEEE